MGDGDDGDDRIVMERRAKKGSKPSSRLTAAGSSIIDITFTPDVAVWAKEVRRREGTDKVREPSKIRSITTKSTTDETMVDPANKKEVAANMANGGDSLTDEADISRNKGAS